MQQHCINMQIYDCLLGLSYKYTGGQKIRRKEKERKKKKKGKRKKERREKKK